jgi:hypothetical protein
MESTVSITVVEFVEWAVALNAMLKGRFVFV